MSSSARFPVKPEKIVNMIFNTWKHLLGGLDWFRGSGGGFKFARNKKRFKSESDSNPIQSNPGMIDSL